MTAAKPVEPVEPVEPSVAPEVESAVSEDDPDTTWIITLDGDRITTAEFQSRGL